MTAKRKAKSKAKAKPGAKSKAKAGGAKKRGSRSAADKGKVAKKRAAATKGAAKGKSAPKKKTAARGKTAPKKKTTKKETGAAQPKMLTRDFLIRLAMAVRSAVATHVRDAKGRDVVGSAKSGDATFAIDEVAEKALLNFLTRERLPVAYYSEDAGYATFTGGQPENLLIVDPIDGTRAAKSGFESCVISVASTRVIERPCMADVDNACIMEIVGNHIFYAERGKGTRIYRSGKYRRPRLSMNTDLETVAWSMTVPARPAELIFPTAAKLIDLTSLKGGFFACNSTSYSLTRLVTGQLDACVDLANRFYRDIPSAVEDHFINAGRGVILGIAPYDLVASLLIAREAGCKVTDAYGDSFDDVLLLDSTVSNLRSMLAASNEELHEALLEFFDARIKQFEFLLKRHSGNTR